ncbi:MAG: phage holin family protein [Bacillota bacterium]
MKEVGAKSVLGALAALGAWLFGALDQAMLILVTVMALDYASGVTSAVANKRLDSRVGLKGIAKKVGMLILVALAYQVSRLTGAEAVRLAVVYFLVGNEALSVLENISELGVGVPEWLKAFLGRLKESKPDA